MRRGRASGFGKACSRIFISLRIDAAQPVTPEIDVPRNTRRIHHNAIRIGIGAGCRPAPQGFLGHLIAREYSQEECGHGETRSGIGGGGESPKGHRRRRLAGPLGTVFGPAQTRRGAAATARGRSRIRVAGAGDHGGAGQASLKSLTPDARDEDNRRLQAKIGELLMETELLYAKVDQLEAGGPLARRRSRR